MHEKKMCIFWENNDKYQPFTAENGDEKKMMFQM